MDKAINFKIEEFKKALGSLDRAIKEEKNDLIRDSIIKRFEYTFELCWKCGKITLRNKYGIEIFSPKECFRNLRKNNLISDSESELALQMTDDRNEIIHTYNENFSNEAYEKILKKYFRLLKNIYEILKLNI